MKKILSGLLIGCMCVGLVGCGSAYEDTNGAEDFSLQTITDENIISLDTGASGLGYSESKVGGITSTEYSSKNFNGVEQIYQTDYILPSDVGIYIGHMNVKSGNFRLVVVNDDRIIFDVPLDSFGDTYYFEDLTGSFAVHVAGESAAFEFHLSIE